LNHSNSRKRDRWIFGGVVGLMLLTVAGIGGCQRWGYPLEANRSLNRSTDTHSSQFATDTDKIQFLKRYLTLPTAVEAAEFHVVYHDNSGGGIPGPSDWDIQAVLKVAPQHLSAWTQDAKITSKKQDLAWGYRLAQQRGWKFRSAPKFYTATGKIVAVFEKEGFIFQKVATMP
jgi:hypothetical protein